MTLRHWSSESEAYAPVEVLVQHLRSAWEVVDSVEVVDIYFGTARCSRVYYFQLARGSERVRLPVLENPVVGRLVAQFNVITCPPNTDWANARALGDGGVDHKHGNNTGKLIATMWNKHDLLIKEV